MSDSAPTPLYSVGTWDSEAEGYTPQIGIDKSFNLTKWELRRALSELRCMDYSAHRFRDPDGGHDDNDWTVLVERTDGKSEYEILEQWRRPS